MHISFIHKSYMNKSVYLQSQIIDTSSCPIHTQVQSKIFMTNHDDHLSPDLLGLLASSRKRLRTGQL